jgi:hypothetical protein
VVEVALSLTWLRQQIEHLAWPPGTAVTIMRHHVAAATNNLLQ